MPLTKRLSLPPQDGIQCAPLTQEKAGDLPPIALSQPSVVEYKVGKVMTKDDYWTRKESRDIRTGECIRLSGILQALLGSVNYGQYCTIADKAAYLAQVKEDAKMLAKFVTEEA